MSARSVWRHTPSVSFRGQLWKRSILGSGMNKALFVSVQLHFWSCTQLGQERDLLILYRNSVLLKRRIPATVMTRVMTVRIIKFCQRTGLDRSPVKKMMDSESVT